MWHPKTFKISSEIAREAQKCVKGQKCLSEPNFKLCATNFDEASETTILLCSTDVDCPYGTVIGNRKVCTCPIRQEIFNKYRI